jgi:hypothetical protein
VNGKPIRKLLPFEWSQFRICFDYAGCSRLAWNESYGGKIENVVIVAEDVLKEFPERNPESKAPSDQEIDKLILDADVKFGRRTGQKLLWKIGQENGLHCTKERLNERANLAQRNINPSVGRPEKIAPNNCPKN